MPLPIAEPLVDNLNIPHRVEVTKTSEVVPVTILARVGYFCKEIVEIHIQGEPTVNQRIEESEYKLNTKALRLIGGWA